LLSGSADNADGAQKRGARRPAPPTLLDTEELWSRKVFEKPEHRLRVSALSPLDDIREASTGSGRDHERVKEVGQ